MPARNLLHKTKLEDFKSYLDEKGIPYRPGKGDYQILQVQHPDHGWLVIYSKLEAPEHYSVPWKLTSTVEKFIHWSRKPQAGMSMPQPKVEVGEVWFIQQPGASALTTVRITDLTAATVELAEQTLGARPMRYKRSDINFIERHEECNS